MDEQGPLAEEEQFMAEQERNICSVKPVKRYGDERAVHLFGSFADRLGRKGEGIQFLQLNF